MIELFYKSLRMVSVGIIILDEEHNIIFLNHTIERLGILSEEEAVGKKIGEVLPVFAIDQYHTMIQMVFETGQSRFCSSGLHKSFVFPKGESRDSRRQNMKIELIPMENKNYALLQVIDISESFINEVNMKKNLNELKKGIDDLNSTKEATEKLARYDILTGLLNRFYFELKFNKLAEETKEKGEKLAILFLDVDGFKTVNDTYGHMIGDGLLQMIAARIKNNKSDLDFVMRLGGDEFIIAQMNVGLASYAKQFAESLLEILKRPYYIDGKVINISACIGISVFPDHSGHLTELIDKADKAMYYSKNNGKGKTHLYDDTL